MTVREGILYAVHDGVELRGDLYSPAGPGPHPVLVAVPGGGWVRGDRKGLRFWGEHLSGAGVAVFSIDYRRSTNGPIFPQNVRDVIAAMRFVDAEAAALGVDRERLGLLGTSAGAHLVALAALGRAEPLIGAEYPDDVGAGNRPKLRVLVTVYGIFDLAAHWRADSLKGAASGEDLTERMLGADPDADPELYRLASPITYVSACSDRPDVLVIWGDSDPDVLPVQSEAFATALKGPGYPVETIVAEGAGHFWFSRDPVDDPSTFNARVAPKLEAFPQDRLVGA